MTDRFLADTKAILSRLIAYPTLSADSNIEMIADLATILEGVGARVEIFSDSTGNKANLFATLGPEGDGGIVLSGHCDVVPVVDQPWEVDPFALTERDGLWYGRGSCDMKGFIAATLALAPYFALRIQSRPLHFAFTYDEEVGCIGASRLAEDLRIRGVRPSVAIIGEPTSMRVIEGHKGCYEYSTRFHGLAGHGSAPDLGVNAVEFAVRYVARLIAHKDRLRARPADGNRFDPPWTTVNIGRVSGGLAHNVIADQAEVDWEMRPTEPGDVGEVTSDLRDFCDNILLPEMRSVFPQADITTEVVGAVEGLLPADKNEALEIVSSLTGEKDPGVVPFCTEAGIFQTMGMDCVICGPGSIKQAHKANEFVSIDQMRRCISMLEGLGDRLSGSEA